MNLLTREHAGAVVATVEGRIDHVNADGFMAALKSLITRDGDGAKALVLDFSRVIFVSSAGLRVLIVAAREAKDHGRKLAVAAAQPMVQEVFSISRLQLMLPCYLDVDSACGALG